MPACSILETQTPSTNDSLHLGEFVGVSWVQCNRDHVDRLWYVTARRPSIGDTTREDLRLPSV